MRVSTTTIKIILRGDDDVINNYIISFNRGLSAIIGSIVGIGGGIIIVPTMVYLGVEHGLLDIILQHK